MRFYTFALMMITLSNGIKFNLELQKNILKFGYGINYKYEGMFMHTFDRFYIVTKFMLPSVEDIKFSKLKLRSFLCIYEQGICP